MVDTAPSICTGRCLCGAVTFEAEGTPIVVARCYCINCQRGSGTGHTTDAMFPVDRFRLSGVVAEFTLTSDSGSEVTRVFCPKCGSPILGRNSGMVGFVTVGLGTFDDASHLRPDVAIFNRSKRGWDVESETLPSFAAQPDWTPDNGV